MPSLTILAYQSPAAQGRVHYISYDQEVIAKGSAVKMRGLAAFRFAGAIRTLGQLLRRACNFVLDATYTLGRLHPLWT